MGTEPAILECAPIIDDVMHALDEADAVSWKDRAMRAAGFLKQALARGATSTAAYWKKRYQHAIDMQKEKPDARKDAAAEPAPPEKKDAAAPPPTEPTKAADDDGPEITIEPDAEEPKRKPADDEKPADTEKPADAEKPADEKPADEELPADEKTVDDDAKDVDVEGLSEEEAALVQNKKHRERVGKEAAGEVAKKRGGIMSGLGDLLGGIAGAVGAVGNWVAGGLSSLDAKTLGKAAGTLVFAALGGLAFGGVGALAGMALAQYFASKASSEREEGVQFDVHRAFALAEKKDGAKAGQAQWANHVLDAVQQGFENLGDMDPKEMAAILKAAKRFKKDLLPPKKGA